MCYRDAVIGFLKSTLERTIDTHWGALFHENRFTIDPHSFTNVWKN